MSDPVIEAIHRVDEICQQGRLGIYLNFKSPISREHAVALEVLRPIRALLEEWDSGGLLDYGRLQELVYTTEELA